MVNHKYGGMVMGTAYSEEEKASNKLIYILRRKLFQDCIIDSIR